MRKALHTVHQFLGGKRETCSLYVVKPGALQVAHLNCSLVDFYNVQSKFTDVSGERAVFIFRVEADLIGGKKCHLYRTTARTEPYYYYYYYYLIINLCIEAGVAYSV